MTNPDRVIGQGADELVTFRIGAQWMAIPVHVVQEVLLAQTLAVVPLAPPEVAGLLNLRGQIVTVVDLRTRLDCPGETDLATAMHVVIKYEQELMALLVDDVGDVLTCDARDRHARPSTLPPAWQRVVTGLVRRGDDLLVVLDVASMFGRTSTAPV